MPMRKGNERRGREAHFQKPTGTGAIPSPSAQSGPGKRSHLLGQNAPIDSFELAERLQRRANEVAYKEVLKQQMEENRARNQFLKDKEYAEDRALSARIKASRLLDAQRKEEEHLKRLQRYDTHQNMVPETKSYTLSPQVETEHGVVPPRQVEYNPKPEPGAGLRPCIRYPPPPRSLAPNFDNQHEMTDYGAVPPNQGYSTMVRSMDPDYDNHYEIPDYDNNYEIPDYDNEYENPNYGYGAAVPFNQDYNATMPEPGAGLRPCIRYPPPPRSLGPHFDNQHEETDYGAVPPNQGYSTMVRSMDPDYDNHYEIPDYDNDYENPDYGYGAVPSSQGYNATSYQQGQAVQLTFDAPPPKPRSIIGFDRINSRNIMEAELREQNIQKVPDYANLHRNYGALPFPENAPDQFQSDQVYYDPYHQQQGPPGVQATVDEASPPPSPVKKRVSVFDRMRAKAKQEEKREEGVKKFLAPTTKKPNAPIRKANQEPRIPERGAGSRVRKTKEELALHDRFMRRREELKKESDLTRNLKLEEQKRKHEEEIKEKEERLAELAREKKLKFEQDRERQRREAAEKRERVAFNLALKKEEEEERRREKQERVLERHREMEAQRMAQQSAALSKGTRAVPAKSQSLSAVGTDTRPGLFPRQRQEQEPKKADWNTSTIQFKDPVQDPFPKERERLKLRAKEALDAGREVPRHIALQLGMPVPVRRRPNQEMMERFRKMDPDPEDEEEVEEFQLLTKINEVEAIVEKYKETVVAKYGSQQPGETLAEYLKRLRDRRESAAAASGVKLPDTSLEGTLKDSTRPRSPLEMHRQNVRRRLAASKKQKDEKEGSEMASKEAGSRPTRIPRPVWQHAGEETRKWNTSGPTAAQKTESKVKVTCDVSLQTESLLDYSKTSYLTSGNFPDPPTVARPETSEEELLERDELIKALGERSPQRAKTAGGYFNSPRAIKDFKVQVPKRLGRMAKKYGLPVSFEYVDMMELEEPEYQGSPEYLVDKMEAESEYQGSPEYLMDKAEWHEMKKRLGLSIM